MAKKTKVWQVKPEFDGTVTIERECKPVALTNALTQQELGELAKLPNVGYYLEQVSINEPKNGQEEN